MILCSCAVIRQEELREAIRSLHAENPGAPITPNRVYRKIGRAPTCMVCAPLLVRRIYRIANDVIVREGIMGNGPLPPAQRAMAVAMIYPNPEKGGRGRKGLGDPNVSAERLSRARTVLAFAQRAWAGPWRPRPAGAGSGRARPPSAPTRAVWARGVATLDRRRS